MKNFRTWFAVAALGLAMLIGQPASADQKLLDINSATVEQLNALQGIGDSKARAIIAYRDEHGPFKTVDELKDVKGIGDSLLASLRPQVTVGSSGSNSASGGAKTAR